MIRSLVFEGGGVKGIAYLGALKVMQDSGTLQYVERVAGTSAGAINALLLALGLTLKEQQDELQSLNFSDFLDDTFGIVRDFNRLLTEYGIYRGQYFDEWIGGLIEIKLGSRNATFADLKKAGGYDLYITGTNVSKGITEVFSYETTPDMTLGKAVRISMSIPFFFQCVRHNGDIYVDGGVQWNYPIRIFDRLKYIVGDQDEAMRNNTSYYKLHNSQLMEHDIEATPFVYNNQVLGFRLDTPQEIEFFTKNIKPKSNEINHILDFGTAVVNALLATQQRVHLNSVDSQRTIYIDDVGVEATEFTLSDQQKQDLYISGRDATRKYFINHQRIH